MTALPCFILESIAGRTLLILSVAAGLSSLIQPVQAQSYPDRPIRLIVPFAPGGGASLLGRVVGDQISNELGQPVLLVNRDGAGTIIGYNEVANSAADGYMLLLGGDAGVINAASGRKLPYDLIRDLDPVTTVYSGAQVMMGTKTSKFNSLRDMVSYGRANPGQIKFGSTGIGTSVHMSSEKFNQAASIKTLHVPYKGATPATTDLMAGLIDYVISGSSGAFPSIKAGNVKGLAILSKSRSKQMPDLPTAIEQGVNVETDGWYGIFMRAGSPPDALRKVHGALAKGLATGEVYNRFETMGGEPKLMSQQEFRAYLIDEIQKLSKLMKDLNIKLED